MNFHILTLFPEMVMQGLMTSITGRAVEQNRIGIEAINIRDFSKDKHKKVDDYPYGGGAGMLMQAQPVYDAYCSVNEKMKKDAKKRVIYLTPQGTPFTQRIAENLAQSEELILLCGHYEGIDERVLEEIVTDYISIGDYVLTGGELAAMVVVDAVSRLVPQVLHNETSAETESFLGNLLEYPQYSRPPVWHGKEVPKVLLGGNQRQIDVWRKEQSVSRTRERRPDLYEKFLELEACKELLMKQKLLHIDMIEAIARGRAILVARRGSEMLLMEKESHVLYHTWMDVTEEIKFEESLLYQMEELCPYPCRCLALHQREMLSVAEKLGFSLDMECVQAVYTKKEKLPVRGLYQVEGEEVEVRPLTVEYLDFVMQTYHLGEHEAYIRNRLEHQAVFGAFVSGEVAGFIGIHNEGSIGMLEVLPKYRGKKIAMTLETEVFNRFIENGMTPYGQVVVGNEASISLQEKLGLCLSKQSLYWLSK